MLFRAKALQFGRAKIGEKVRGQTNWRMFRFETSWWKLCETLSGTVLDFTGSRSHSRAARLMFNETVLEHFRNPRNAGEVADATAVVEVVNPVCGDVLRLSVRLDAGRVAEARFKTQGCVAAIAASSA